MKFYCCKREFSSKKPCDLIYFNKSVIKGNDVKSAIKLRIDYINGIRQKRGLEAFVFEPQKDLIRRGRKIAQMYVYSFFCPVCGCVKVKIVLYSKYSTLILKQRRIDGILTLYPNRMEFKTMQGAFVSAISLLNINRMEEYTRFLFFHTGLKIICNDSTEWNLILNNRAYWLRIINNQLLGLHGEGNTQSDNALQYAMNLMNNELYNKAIWEWTCLIKDNQYLETAYLQRGTAYFVTNDLENAKLDCETAISMFPNNPENHVAYFILAHCANLLNATETALYYIEQALLLKPEDPLYYRESCIINYNAKNFELAYKHVLSAIRLGLVDDEVLQYKNYLEQVYL